MIGGGKLRLALRYAKQRLGEVSLRWVGGLKETSYAGGLVGVRNCKYTIVTVYQYFILQQTNISEPSRAFSKDRVGGGVCLVET